MAFFMLLLFFIKGLKPLKNIKIIQFLLPLFGESGVRAEKNCFIISKWYNLSL